MAYTSSDQIAATIAELCADTQNLILKKMRSLGINKIDIRDLYTQCDGIPPLVVSKVREWYSFEYIDRDLILAENEPVKLLGILDLVEAWEDIMY